MKKIILSILVVTFSSFSQTFDSPRNLLTGKKPKFKYYLVPGFNYQYHNIGSSNFNYLGRSQENFSYSSYGLSAMFQFGRSVPSHGIRASFNYGWRETTLRVSQQVAGQGGGTTLNFNSDFDFTSMNIDLTYHYYIFGYTFGFFAGTSFIILNQMDINSGDWENPGYTPDEGLTYLSELNEEFEQGNSIAAILGAEYIFEIMSLQAHIGVSYAIPLTTPDFEIRTSNNIETVDLSNWSFSDFRWNINFCYPIKL